MKNKLFQGIMPAMITPFYADGTLNEEAARRMIEHHLAKGVAGFYICGGTGEGALADEKTRMRMAEVTVETVAGRAKVIDHVGTSDAWSALRLARHAAEIGCDAVSSLPPTFYVSYSDDEVLDYYRGIAEAAQIPVLVYATGAFKHQDISPLVARMMEIEHVIGLKFTRYDFYEMRRVIELNGGDINVINGPDEMLICGLTMGADAGIGSTYNVMPGLFLRLFNSFKAGDFATAQQTQYKINVLIAVLKKYGVIRAIKKIYEFMGIEAGGPAFPGRALDAEEAKALKKDLDGIRFVGEYWEA